MASMTFSNRTYRLDKMSLRELCAAYFLYPAIQTYLFFAVVFGALSWTWSQSLLPIGAAMLAVALVYPLVWYLLHRFVLHGRFLYRSRFTAAVWKRIHFDHHRDPHDLRVLFGALYTTMPTVFIAVTPIGWMIGGAAGAAAAITAGLLVTCFYEFCHCIQHLRITPRSRFLRQIKRLHLQHHFHDEHTNFGITNFVPDRLFGTFDDNPKGKAHSPTVFNLGYTGDEVRRFPWVARITPDLDEITAARDGVSRRQPRP